MSTGRSYPTALEIGCGNGNGTRLIKKHYRPEKIVAIDLDEKMIQLAREDIKDDSVDFMVMDASQLEFPDNFFDAVFDFGIIHHIANWRVCIHELRRVLKDDGELIIEELASESFTGFPGGLWRRILDHPYEDMFTFREFEECLEELGFEITSQKISNFMGLLKHVSLTAKINKPNNS